MTSRPARAGGRLTGWAARGGGRLTGWAARGGGRLTGRTAHRGGGGASPVIEPEVAALADALARAVEGDVEFDDYARHLYSRDASMYSIRPRGVVAPRHAEDVVAAVRVAAEHGVAVLPRGAGTSLAGQTVGDAVVLDFSRYMCAILELDAATRTARVQPGVVQDQLNGRRQRTS